jgi:hypothetical protein
VTLGYGISLLGQWGSITTVDGGTWWAAAGMFRLRTGRDGTGGEGSAIPSAPSIDDYGHFVTFGH